MTAAGELARGVRTVEEPALSLAGLLRQLRAEARLTQEELADAASLSPRAVSDLERGINRTARKDTAGLLADALSLAGPARAAFVAAARGRAPIEDVLAARGSVMPGTFAAAATRTLPRDVFSFTGRQAETERLLGTLAGRTAAGGVVGIYAIGGMAGIGKTALAVHIAHKLAGKFPDGQFFLPLHAHTAGHRPVDPADALASLLLTAGVGAQQIPPGLDARAGRWRDHVAGRKILLLLDDAAGHEQVRPLLPGTTDSLVLITSRRRLTALEDATVISLDILPPGEAAALLAGLAGRPDLESSGPVEELTRLCGYLPLAIGMLARQLRHHPARTAAGLAADLAAARDRLAVMRAENLSVAAAFDLSYADLSPAQQRLFRRLGLVPGPTFDAHAAAALDDVSPDAARRHLDELYDHHLLTEPSPGRYLLHDLLREHARTLADADGPEDRHAVTGRLLDYYLHTALAADRHIATRTIVLAGHLPPGRPPSCAPQLSSHQQATAWLRAERPNLHAAVDYAAASGRTVHAVQVSAAMSGFLLTHGHVEQAAALHQTALAAARQAEDRTGEAVILNYLGFVHGLTGDYPAAVASQQQAITLFRDAGDRPGQAYALNQLGVIQGVTGDYAAAIASQQEALALFRDAGERLGQATVLNELGVVQMRTGDYPAAAASHQQALAEFHDIGHPLGRANALNNLGVVQRLTGDYPGAAASHQQSLALFRDMGHPFGQAWALNSLGVLQQVTGDYPSAAASHQQALALFRDLGSLLGEARALDHLGQLATRTSAHREARDRHAQALTIARDLDAPLEEARALEGIGRSHLEDGNPAEAAAYLRQALAIYQRIGARGARRVQETLRRHEL